MINVIKNTDIGADVILMKNENSTVKIQVLSLQYQLHYHRHRFIVRII